MQKNNEKEKPKGVGVRVHKTSCILKTAPLPRLVKAAPLPRHEMIEDYKKHCLRARRLFGDHVYATVATPAHFNEWLADQKSQDQGLGCSHQQSRCSKIL